MSTSPSESDLIESVRRSDSFWEVGVYKRVVKRIDDGARMCDEMMKLVAERAEIEAKHATKLVHWRKKWDEMIERGPEYGTLQAAWKACLTEAERVSDMHSRIRDGLMSQVHTSIGQWKTDHYHKSFFSWKETKTADDGFEKAQRPWTKRLAKVEKYRKLYHQSAKATEQATRNFVEAERDSSVTPDQCKKAKDKMDKARQHQDQVRDRYREKLREIDSYNPTYMRDMTNEFEKCQEFERQRMDFLRESLKFYKSVIDLSSMKEFADIYSQFGSALNVTNSNDDLDWYSQNHGAKMPMNWPKYEEYEAGVNMEDGLNPNMQGGSTEIYRAQRSPGSVRAPGGAPPLISGPIFQDTPPSAYPQGSSDDDEFIDPPPAAPGVPVRALYDYDATEDDELSFGAGSVLTKLEDEDEQGWCKGMFNGKIGLYPANYVEPV